MSGRFFFFAILFRPATFAAGWLAVVVVMASFATAQTPALQGVQPIFNNQLGAWSAIQPPATSRRPPSQPRPPGGGPIVCLPGHGGHGHGGHGHGGHGHGGHGHGGHGHGGHGHHHHHVPYYDPWYGYPYGGWYPPFYGSGIGYSQFGGWRNWSTYATVPAQPIIVVQPQINIMPPADPAAGGLAANVAGRQPVVGPVGPRVGPPAPEDEIGRRVAMLKASTESGRMRADQLIAEGDRDFAAGSYRRAGLKYRDAINRAPDYSAAYFRAGHAYTATGDYELAVTYFSLAFELARTIDRRGFSLESIYRGDDAAKAEHLRLLDRAAARAPLDGGLPFLTGVFLHYDGNVLKARESFRRAADLPGRHRPYAAMFLPPEPAKP
jgi:hypothetical protein